MNAQDRLEPGTVLGAYEIISFIAAGGMGSVYRARNRILGDLRALKVILPSLSSNPEFVQRFVREAQLAARIQHPNVVKMLEPAMHGDTMFLPMELLEGESLQELARRESPLHPAVAIDLMIPVCAGVHAVHEAGIIHRDVKPANVFLAKDSSGNVVPKLIDLGAARDIDAGEQTSTGAVIGSAHYMPIEQAAGRKDIDLRVDVYALGVMLYLLLTRKRPYENDESGVAMAKVLQGAPFTHPRELAPWIPPELERIVLVTMAREREQRPSSAMEVAEMLASVRPLCEGLVMPPQVRERHMTGSASISRVPGFGGNSGVRDPSSIARRGIPGAEPSQPSAIGVATPIERAAPKSRALPIAAAVTVVGLLAIGGVAVALRGRNQGDGTERLASTRTTAAGAVGAGSSAAIDTTTADSGAAALIEDAQTAVTVEDAQTALAIVDAGAAPRAVRPNRNAGSSGQSTSRGGCVPRPGVPCL
jgi:serine/threonine protein kinase